MMSGQASTPPGWRVSLPYAWHQAVAHTTGIVAIAFKLILKHGVFEAGSHNLQYGHEQGWHECQPGAKDNGGGKVREQGARVAWMANPGVRTTRYNLVSTLSLDACHTREIPILDQGIGTKCVSS